MLRVLSVARIAGIAYGGYQRHAKGLAPDDPVTALSLREARAHTHGDTLADFVVMELHEAVAGTRGDTSEDRLERGIGVMERAIADLEGARDALVAARMALG